MAVLAVQEARSSDTKKGQRCTIVFERGTVPIFKPDISAVDALPRPRLSKSDWSDLAAAVRVARRTSACHRFHKQERSCVAAVAENYPSSEILRATLLYSSDRTAVAHSVFESPTTAAEPAESQPRCSNAGFFFVMDQTTGVWGSFRMANLLLQSRSRAKYN